jgi:dCTP deaminase
MSEPWHDWIPGVLNKNQMRALFQEGLITRTGDAESFMLDNSSFDLTLSNEAYRMLQGTVKPSGRQAYHFFITSRKLAEPLHPNQDGSFLLKTRETYIFKLNEKLERKLGEIDIYGQATAKSSVGRVDVLERLIVDGMETYEEFDPAGLKKQSGAIYLEITPITFPVKVRPDTSLSQLRLFYGEPSSVEVRGSVLFRTIFRDSDKHDGKLTVNLKNESINGLKTAAFRAHVVNEEDAISLWEEKENNKKPDPGKYWDLIESKDDRLQIEPERFYILRSEENIAVPPGIAIYCRASDETIGEMRIHYAGFAHPWFGLERNDGKQGTPLIFEVRGHQVNVSLAHGEQMADLIFYRMSQDATQSSPTKYSEQTLQLSKFFGEWPGK